MKYHASEIKKAWPKSHRSFNAELIPKKFIELAKSGVYFESKMLEPIMPRGNEESASNGL